MPDINLDNLDNLERIRKQILVVADTNSGKKAGVFEEADLGPNKIEDLFKSWKEPISSEAIEVARDYFDGLDGKKDGEIDGKIVTAEKLKNSFNKLTDTQRNKLFVDAVQNKKAQNAIENLPEAPKLQGRATSKVKLMEAEGRPDPEIYWLGGMDFGEEFYTYVLDNYGVLSGSKDPKAQAAVGQLHEALKMRHGMPLEAELSLVSFQDDGYVADVQGSEGEKAVLVDYALPSVKVKTAEGWEPFKRRTPLTLRQISHEEALLGPQVVGQDLQAELINHRARRIGIKHQLRLKPDLAEKMNKLSKKTKTKPVFLGNLDSSSIYVGDEARVFVVSDEETRELGEMVLYEKLGGGLVDIGIEVPGRERGFKIGFKDEDHLSLFAASGYSHHDLLEPVLAERQAGFQALVGARNEELELFEIVAALSIKHGADIKHAFYNPQDKSLMIISKNEKTGAVEGRLVSGVDLQDEMSFGAPIPVGLNESPGLLKIKTGKGKEEKKLAIISGDQVGKYKPEEGEAVLNKPSLVTYEELK